MSESEIAAYAARVFEAFRAVPLNPVTGLSNFGHDIAVELTKITVREKLRQAGKAGSL